VSPGKVHTVQFMVTADHVAAGMVIYLPAMQRAQLRLRMIADDM